MVVQTVSTTEIDEANVSEFAYAQLQAIERLIQAARQGSPASDEMLFGEYLISMARAHFFEVRWRGNGGLGKFGHGNS